jgi:hypothetical protein
MHRLRRIWSRESDSPSIDAEPPSLLEKSEISREDLIAELIRALSERKITCDLGRASSEKSINADLTSDALSLCILSVGCIILVKAAYNELQAFRSLKSREGNDEHLLNSGLAVTIGEFIKYRCSVAYFREKLN